MGRRRIYADELVGAEQIAQRLGLKERQGLHNVRRRYPDFPAPVWSWNRTMVWYWPDVERWLRSTTWRRPQW